MASSTAGLALAVSVGLAGCAHAAAGTEASGTGPTGGASEIRTMVDDGTRGPDLGEFRFTGRWERVTRRRDGRSLGTSTRSFHPRDLAALSFTGSRVRLYGVTGPKGGDAIVSIDGRVDRWNVSFRSATIASNALVYESPRLEPGVHTLVVAVTGRDGATGRAGYVNLDSAVVSQAAGPSDRP